MHAICIYIHIFKCVCIYVKWYVYTHIQTYIHIYRHIYTDTEKVQNIVLELIGTRKHLE